MCVQLRFAVLLDCWVSVSRKYLLACVHVHRTVTSPSLSHTRAPVFTAWHCKIGNPELKVNSLQTWLCPLQRCFCVTQKLCQTLPFCWACWYSRSVTTGVSGTCLCMVLLLMLVVGHCIMWPWLCSQSLKQTGQEYDYISSLQYTTCISKHFVSFKDTGIEDKSQLFLA